MAASCRIEPPNQSTQWRNCGRAAVQRAGLSHRHQVMEEADWSALPSLLAQGTRARVRVHRRVAYLRLRTAGFLVSGQDAGEEGVIAFNDCDWPAVAKVMDFVLTHRRYREIDAGLTKTYQRPSGVIDILRKVSSGRLGDYLADARTAISENWKSGNQPGISPRRSEDISRSTQGLSAFSSI